MPFSTELKYISRAAMKLGIVFPETYVGLLLLRNGGSIKVAEDEWQLYPVFDDSDVKRARRTCSDVVHETLEARDWANFPAAAVAIASNGSGDLLVMLPETQGHLGAAVYQWHHESGDVTRAADDINDLANAG